MVLRTQNNQLFALKGLVFEGFSDVNKTLQYSVRSILIGYSHAVYI